MRQNLTITSIVEGDGDKSAVPGLLRRILHERYCRYDVLVMRPKVAHGKPKLLRRIEQFLRYGLIDACDAILVLIDADRECPFEESSVLVGRIAEMNLPVPVAVVYAKREFESWFICNLVEGGGAQIRQRLGISESIIAPEDVEEIADAKEWLTSRMPQNRSYQETRDQEVLVHHIDLELTFERSRSFRRLCDAVHELVVAIDNCSPTITPRLS